MDTVSESERTKQPREPVKWPGLESLVEDTESLSPKDEFFVLARHRDTEARQSGCENRVYEQVVAATCDCRGESCCC